MGDFITSTMDATGYAGITLLMLLENIFPPIPSEVVMPAAGALARNGERSLMGVVLAGTLGSVLGALPWYGVAWYVGTDRLGDWMERHGHWLGSNRREVERADEWFDRYGAWTVFGCRLIPGIRTLISVPAGFAEMPLLPFLAFTTIGTALWTLLLALLGYWLGGRNETVQTVVEWTGIGVIGALVIWFVARIVRARRRKAA